jgi:3-hydroxy acid dehydrogenase/malonic semialdehyde reductase
MALSNKVVFVTGASSGIGAACARTFARDGAQLLLAARRLDRLQGIEADLRDAGAADVMCLQLDVRDREEVTNTIENLPAAWKAIEILVNNAGLSRGLSGLHEGSESDWSEMIDTNVKGLLSIDRAVVPLMVARGSGTVIHIGSIAGREIYPGGNVYCATKHAVRALTEGLRQDLVGSGVRVCSVDPGMVETEFSEVRFHGNTERAKGVYRGMTPLTGNDVAELVHFTATRPPHVTLADAMILPTDQASATLIHREPDR